MGQVFRALHVRLGKLVALKVLPADRFDDPEAVARFLREMQAVGRLEHPNIVLARDAGEVDGIHFLVMELLEGVDLADPGAAVRAARRGRGLRADPPGGARAPARPRAGAWSTATSSRRT